jgi:hypothetical protein
MMGGLVVVLNYFLSNLTKLKVNHKDMKSVRILLVCTIFFITCAPKDQSLKNWYRGNLHTHSLWSDGDDFPEMIMRWYKTNGYDFVALSDHNTLAVGEKWKVIGERLTPALTKYQEHFDSTWVQTRFDSLGRLEVQLKTLAEYRPLYEEEGEFLIIQSEEVSDDYEGKPIHMNVTNIEEYIPPQGGSSVAEVIQRTLDQVAKQRAETGQPMFLHLNHPNFMWTVTPDDIKKLNGERFIEVYNGHPLVNNYGDSLRPGMEALWDEVLSAYLLNGKEPLYGLAVDDAHNYHQEGPTKSNPGRGWVMVCAGELTPEAIITAMETGDFYATTGVTLSNVSFDGKELTIEVDPEEGVSYTIQFFGTPKTGMESGVLLQTSRGTESSYSLTKDDLYVRAKIVSTKPKRNPFKEGDMEVAWTQPVSGSH